MPAKIMDSDELENCFDYLARKLNRKQLLSLLKVYRILFENGKIEMENPDPDELKKGREYVNSRIEELERVMGCVPT